MTEAVTEIRQSADVLVGADWLEAHLDDPMVRVIQVDVSATGYAAGHIPGAVLWNIYTDLRDEDYRLQPPDRIEQLIRRSGITEDSTAVFYGYAPALGFWLLKHCGHAAVRILNTSRETWGRREARVGNRTGSTAGVFVRSRRGESGDPRRSHRG